MKDINELNDFQKRTLYAYNAFCQYLPTHKQNIEGNIVHIDVWDLISILTNGGFDKKRSDASCWIMYEGFKNIYHKEFEYEKVLGLKSEEPLLSIKGSAEWDEEHFYLDIEISDHFKPYINGQKKIEPIYVSQKEIR